MNFLTAALTAESSKDKDKDGLLPTGNATLNLFTLFILNNFLHTVIQDQKCSVPRYIKNGKTLLEISFLCKLEQQKINKITFLYKHILFIQCLMYTSNYFQM